MNNKILRTMSLVLTFSIVLTMFSSLTASAAGQTAITLKQGDALKYDSSWGWDAVKMTADGKMIYCLQPDLAAPPNGSYRTDNGKLKEITSSDSKYDLYRKALYYCYGGDGFTTSNNAFRTDTSKHQQSVTGNTPQAFMSNLRYSQYGYKMLGSPGAESNLHYLLTHLVLSYINYGDSAYRSKVNGSKVPSDWYGAVVDLYNAIKAAPLPTVATKMYLLDIGSSYQKVIVLRNGIKLELEKQSANPDISEGNSCLGLKTLS